MDFPSTITYKILPIQKYKCNNTQHFSISNGRQRNTKNKKRKNISFFNLLILIVTPHVPNIFLHFMKIEESVIALLNES